MQAGAIGLDPASMTMISGGLLEEMKQSLCNVSAVLRCSGSSPRHVVSCLVWVSGSSSSVVDLSNVKKLAETWLDDAPIKVVKLKKIKKLVVVEEDEGWDPM
jgi:enamine deaminase RidA (YjgF/YER057c/UK114 family)